MAYPGALDAADVTRDASRARTSADHRALHTPGGGAWPLVDTSPAAERLTHGVAILMLVYTAIYIAWRWLFTLNPDALAFSIALAVAETYGLVTAFFMTYTTWTLKRREAPPAPDGLTVDVFVTTYDEPLNVIRKTALAAREIRYPHRTYILDDGKRDEIRALAEDLGVEYLRRPDNRHAKAGNLNHALAHSSGEFILQLDADHVPQPQILHRLLGFFHDDRVALAQSPQDFYNTDAFTYDVNETARRIWEDQQLFFRIIQPGKDARDAAFFVGSCAVLRRKALEDVGGFATSTITEDIETSLLLHSRGWRSVFYGETLAYGLAPGSAAAFHTQHLRWGQGAMQALRRYRPLTMRGLTTAQRIGYFDSLTTYFSGFQRLVFYLAPAVFFLTGQFPVRADALQFCLIFAPYITLQFMAFKLLSRGHGSLLLADRYGMAKFFTHLLAVTAYFSRGALKFRVTPKGVTDVPFRTYAPQLALAGLTAVAVLWGVIAASFHITSYAAPGWGSLAFYVNLLFAAWTFYSAMYIVDMSVRLRTQRQDHRYADTMPVEIKVLREGRHVRHVIVGVTNDLNPNGLSFRSSEVVEDGAWVEVRLPLLTRPVDVKGRVVHRNRIETTHGDVYNHGVEFVALSWEVRDAIELHCAHYTTPLRRQRYVQAFSAVGDALRWMRDPRRARRAPVGMAVHVEMRRGTNWADIGLGLWEDVSETGARLLLEEPLDIGDWVRASVDATSEQFTGEVVFVRALETALGARFVIGLRRSQDAIQQLSPKPRGRTVNWNTFDRLLNRTRAEPSLHAREPADIAALAESGTPHVEVLRPKSAPRVEETGSGDAVEPGAQPLPRWMAGAEYFENSLRASQTAEANTIDADTSDESPFGEAYGSGTSHTDVDEYASGADAYGGAFTEAPSEASLEDDVAFDAAADAFHETRSPYIESANSMRDENLVVDDEHAGIIGDDSFAQQDAADPTGAENTTDAIAPAAHDVAAHDAFVAAATSQPATHFVTPSHSDTGAHPMMTEQILQPQSAAAQYGPPSETSMLTVWGGGARLDGKFEIDDSIEVRCELSGEVAVGGRIVIEEGGIVNATVRTVDAEVRGTFNGDLYATGSVHITETGRVTGNIQTEELVIARGGFFNGNVTRPEDSAPARGRDHAAPRGAHNGARNGTQRNGAPRRNGADTTHARTESHADEQESLRPRLRRPDESPIA